MIPSRQWDDRHGGWRLPVPFSSILPTAPRSVQVHSILSWSSKVMLPSPRMDDPLLLLRGPRDVLHAMGFLVVAHLVPTGIHHLRGLRPSFYRMRPLDPRGHRGVRRESACSASPGHPDRTSGPRMPTSASCGRAGARYMVAPPPRKPLDRPGGHGARAARVQAASRLGKLGGRGSWVES